MNLQPNSTAPTDGTKILAYWDESDEMQIVYFDCEHPEEPGWVYVDVDYNFQVKFPFSHWMPLPASPNEEEISTKNIPLQQESFVECSYEKATVFKLNDKVFSIHGQTASKTSTGVSLRMQFDRWTDFDLQDFQILGIECFELEQEKPIEFVGEVISLNLSGRHMGSKLHIEAPPGSKGKKFRCVEIDDVDWWFISKYQTLSEEFIREFKDRVNWTCISFAQTLSEGFIREFRERVNWFYISQYQTLSYEFREEFKHKLRV